MSKITLERYFYPVGQGLCCRERFIFNDEIDNATGKPKEFNLVYDCGSGIGKKPNGEVKKLIENIFRGVNINYIFISHFHNDHTNLLDTIIDSCKQGGTVKKILIPCITEEEKNILLYLDGHVNQKLIQAAVELLDDESTKYRDVGLFRNSVLEKDVRLPFWKYHKTGYNSNILKGQFLHNINNRKNELKGLSRYTIKDLSIFKNPDFIKRNKTVLKEIYEDLGDLNEQSEILFSFPVATPNNVKAILGFELQGFGRRSIGAIYFGDYPLHDNNISIQKYFSANIKRIGVIQIPHHGSNTGIYPPLYQKNIFYTIPFGIHNRYGHPTKGVVLSITAMEDSLPIYITEHSYYIQKFEFEIY